MEGVDNDSYEVLIHSLTLGQPDIDPISLETEFRTCVNAALDYVDLFPSVSLDVVHERLKEYLPHVQTCLQGYYEYTNFAHHPTPRQMLEPVVMKMLEDISHWDECRRYGCMSLLGDRRLFHHRAGVRHCDWIDRERLKVHLTTVGTERLKTGRVLYYFDIRDVLDVLDRLPLHITVAERQYEDRSRRRLLEKSAILYEEDERQDGVRCVILLEENGDYSTTIEDEDVVSLAQQMQAICPMSDHCGPIECYPSVK